MNERMIKHESVKVSNLGKILELYNKYHRNNNTTKKNFDAKKKKEEEEEEKLRYKQMIKLLYFSCEYQCHSHKQETRILVFQFTNHFKHLL